jgi:hypothetical protein
VELVVHNREVHDINREEPSEPPQTLDKPLLAVARIESAKHAITE